MEVKINLSDELYQRIFHRSQIKNISVNELIKNAVIKGILEESSNFKAQVKIIEQSMEFCSEKEIIELCNLQMPVKKDERLSFLLQKQNENDLTKAEDKEFWKLMELNRLTTLRKAFGLREISRRGLKK